MIHLAIAQHCFKLHSLLSRMVSTNHYSPVKCIRRVRPCRLVLVLEPLYLREGI
jgi:hypothetical protein